MRFPRKRTFRSDGLAVRADADPGLSHRQPQIRLAHAEVDRFRQGSLIDEQVAQGVHRVFAHHPGDFVHALAFVLLVLWLFHPSEQDSVPPAHAHYFIVVPTRQAGGNRLADFRASFGILEALYDLF